MHILTDYVRDANVAYGATLGGILYYAGTMAVYMKDATIPKSEYNFDALLSVFCGNFVKEANFSIAFDQTRVELLPISGPC